MERQQHLEEQHRLHISAAWLDPLNTTTGAAGVNGTDHVDDFIARIDKLRQVTPCSSTCCCNGTMINVPIPRRLGLWGLGRAGLVL